MSGSKTAKVTITDSDDPNRFDIPQEMVQKPTIDDHRRLENLGFDFNQDPFYISYTDPTDPSNVFLSTKN